MVKVEARITNGRIDWLNRNFGGSYLCWGFYIKTEEGAAITGSITQCRESLIERIKEALLGQFSIYTKPGEMDLKRPRVTCLAKPKTKQQREDIIKTFRRGKRIVNFFERKMGWELTKVHTGDCKQLDTCMIKLIEGPEIWQYSPHLFSLYVMLFRLGKYKQFDGFKTYAQFKNISKKLCDRMLEYLVDFNNPKAKHDDLFIWPMSGSSDIFHLKFCADKIMAVLENIDKIYEKREQKSLYSQSSYLDGFTALCRRNIRDSDVEDNFTKVLKKEKIKLTCDPINTEARRKIGTLDELRDRTALSNTIVSAQNDHVNKSIQ